jgi:hypothetical protein
MFRQRLLVLGALATLGSACALTDEAATPTVTDDGGSLGTDVVTLDDAASANVTNLTVAEFIGRVDESGELTIELLPVEEWLSPVDERSLFGLRDVAQANWCELRVTQGRPETVGLSTVGGSIGFSLAACGLPDAFPFNATGAFCADIEVSNFYPDTLTDVYAEITSITPDAGYGGYTYAATGGLIGADPSGLTGNNAPTDVAGGLFGYGDLAGNSSGVQQWAFQNEGGVFSFRGRVLGVVAETCDGVDNDCDGDIDEQAGCLAEGEVCVDNFDCATGNCDAGLCGASLCLDTILNGTETDVDCGGACDPCADGLVCLVDADCASDICLDGTCAQFDRPTPGDLVITEFYANPDGDETVREFVEVYNRTGAGLNLNGCSLTDGSETYVWPADAIVPNGYGVLARGGAPTADDAPAGDVTYENFILANSGDTIRIECNGLVIDEVVYTEAQNSGVTTQLDAGVLTALANDDPANFCTTPTSTFAPLGVRGTPGAANDACPSFDLQTGDFCTVDLAGTVAATAAGTLRAQASLSIAGLTDQTDDVDTLAQIQVQLGFGPTGFAEFDPAWSWTAGVAVDDWYDTYGVDGYEALLTMSTAGNYVLAARVSTDNGATFTYCDRRLGAGQRGSEDGFLLADAVQLTVDAGVAAPAAAGDVFFTELMPNAVNPGLEVAEFVELFNPGATALDLDGCIIADNNRPGNDHVIQGALRIEAGGYLVVTYAGSFDENYGLLGDYSIDGEFNMSNGGDSIVLDCGGTVIDTVVWDTEGEFDSEGISNQLMPTRSDNTSNDTLSYWCYTPAANTYGDGTHVGTPGAANPPCATIDACRVQSPVSIVSGAPNADVTVTGRLQSLGLSDLTTGSDATDAVTAEIGWGADGSDPASGGWTWFTATTDGAWEDSAVVSQYTGTLTLPAAGLFDFDFAYRFSADAGLNYVYCDTTDGDATYTAADAGQGSTAEIVDLTGVTCGVDAALSGFAGIATTANASVNFTASCGTPSAALVVEVGYGPAGGDASLDAGDFTYSAVSFNACSGLQGQFSGSLVAPTAFDANLGTFELAGRVSGDGGATWIYCDGNAGAYASADNGVLTVESATADLYQFDIGTSQTVTEFTSVTLGMQWADPGVPSLTVLTNGVDVSSDVVIECGWAADGVDPVANPNSWNWFAASPIAGWSDAFGFDGWDCEITAPATGTYDTAFRISTDAGTTYTYVDTAGNTTFSAPGELVATADPNAPCLLFTEYVEGSSNNKGLEIHNCGTADVDLANIQLCWENNDNTTCDTAVSLGSTGVLAAGDVFTVCASAWALAPTCDLSLPFPAPVYFNGDDRVGLFQDINGDAAYGAGEPLYDFILQSGFNDPSNPGENLTWRRRADACTSFNGQGAFVPGTYYTEHPQNDVDDFGTFAGCINAQFVELLEGDNGGFGISNVTIDAAGLVLNAGAGALVGLPPLDCSGEGDVEVTAVISATDCTAATSIDVGGTGATAPVVGSLTFTVPGTAGSLTSPAISVSGTEACTVTLDAVYASCPAVTPTVVAGDIIVSEVSVDGPTTWVELTNVSGAPLDATGLQVSVDGLRYVVTSPEFLASDYFAASADGSVGTQSFLGYGVTVTSSSTIAVLAGSLVVDTLTLDGGANFPSGATGSINLSTTKLTAADNDAATSWCTSDTQTWNGGANFGSPGLANDACPSLGNTPTTFGQLIITEFESLASEEEFVEVFNPTAQDFDMAGCTFGDTGEARVIGTDVTGDTIVEAGAYYVFGATADSVTDVSGNSLVDGVYGNGSPGLSGSGDTIQVICGGTTIAELTYNGTEFGYTSSPTITTSQLDPRYYNAAASADGAFWCGSDAGSTYNAEPGGVAVYQGTPGAANTNCGGVTAPMAPGADVLFVSELIGSPDNGDFEWIELYNPTSTTFDLSGLYHIDSTSKPAGDFGLFPAGSLIGPGEYFVFSGDADAVVDAEGTSLVDAVLSNLEGISGSGDDVFICTANNDGCATALVTFTSNGFTSDQSNGLDPDWFNPGLGGTENLANWCDDDTSSYLNGDGSANTGTPGAANRNCSAVTDPAFVDIVQNSLGDGAGTWSLTPAPAFGTGGFGFWDIDDSAAPQNSVTAAAVPDGTRYIYADDLNNFGNFITLSQVDVSAYAAVEVSFWYYSFGYDSTDDAWYQVVVDGAAFDTENSGALLDKSTGAWEQVTISVPGGAQTVALQIFIDQNGGDNIAFDDFRVRGILSGSSAFTPGTIDVTLGSPTFDSNPYPDVVQVANAEAGPTPGGVAVSDNRTVYGFDSDAFNEAPSYIGADHPYVILEVTDTITTGAGVTASVGWVVEHGSGRRVLSIDGYPMYQFAADTSDTDAAGVGEFGFHAFAGDGTSVEEVVSGPAPITLAEQSFEGTETTPWNFTPTPAPYNAGATDDAWGVAASPYGGVTATDGANVWGGVDNDNPTASGDHVLEFDVLNVAGFTDVTVSFDYSAGYNSTDRLDYEIAIDGGAFAATNLVLGTDTGGFQSVTIPVPDGSSTVQLRLILNQNGNGQFGMWDNVLVTGVASPQTVAAQSFEGTETTPWSFTPTPAPYNAGATDDAWGVAASPYGGVTATDGANVWGGVDNDNPTASGDHVLEFDSLDISGFDSVSLSFDYSADYNSSDRLDYEISVDGGAFAATNLVLGTNTGGFQSVTVPVPDGSSTVQLRLILNQNGNSQYGMWDNIVVVGTPNGMGGGPAEVDACINNPCTGSNVTCDDIVPSNDDTTAGRTCTCDAGFENYTDGGGCTAIAGGPTLVINEVDGDTPGTDTAEFVELYDGGVGNTPLDGYVLVFFNGSNDSVYAEYDLDTFTTDANGYFVIGNVGVNGVQITFSSNGLQNGADAVALYTGNPGDVSAPTTTSLVDAVVHDTSDSDDTGLLTGLGQTTQYNEAENGDKDNESIARSPDGGPFTTQLATPGAAN